MEHKFIMIKRAFLIACLVLSWSSVSAEQPDLIKKLSTTIESVLDVLHEEEFAKLSSDEKNERLLTLVESQFSLDVMVQRALGRNWRKLSAEQQSEFKRLFSKLLVHTYTSRLDESEERPQFEFGDQIELPKNRVEIKSTVEYLNDKISVDYRLFKKDGNWGVYDIVVEGVSLLGNYRKQFNSLMSRGSANELLDTLQKKVEKL